MRYFYIFILTLILISCNEKKGYGTTIEYGAKEKVDPDYCRSVIRDGRTIFVMERNEMQGYEDKVVYWKGSVYRIIQFENKHTCKYKREFWVD